MTGGNYSLLIQPATWSHATSLTISIFSSAIACPLFRIAQSLKLLAIPAKNGVRKTATVSLGPNIAHTTYNAICLSCGRGATARACTQTTCAKIRCAAKRIKSGMQINAGVLPSSTKANN